jgi:hypothetical protein
VPPHADDAAEELDRADVAGVDADGDSDTPPRAGDDLRCRPRAAPGSPSTVQASLSTAMICGSPPKSG